MGARRHQVQDVSAAPTLERDSARSDLIDFPDESMIGKSMLSIFRQPRIGLHGKPFMLYKLKTMQWTKLLKWLLKNLIR
jgi:hypothetical protein